MARRGLSHHAHPALVGPGVVASEGLHVEVSRASGFPFLVHLLVKLGRCFQSFIIVDIVISLSPSPGAVSFNINKIIIHLSSILGIGAVSIEHDFKTRCFNS